MKHLIVLTFFFLFGCNSTKFVKNPPFKILDAYYQNWYGGREGVKGIAVKIKITNTSDNIKFHNMYFKNHKLDVSINNSNNVILISSNINTGYKPEDRQMHINPKEEYQNKLPKKEAKFPFKLKENEAVISYTKNNKLHFYKITLKNKKELYMP